MADEDMDKAIASERALVARIAADLSGSSWEDLVVKLENLIETEGPPIAMAALKLALHVSGAAI